MYLLNEKIIHLLTFGLSHYYEMYYAMILEYKKERDIYLFPSEFNIWDFWLLISGVLVMTDIQF